MNKVKFWNWLDEENTLHLNGTIAAESWFEDNVTPQMFKSDLDNFTGKDITVWINSHGGDVFAASNIYNMLKEHKGKVTVKVDGLAASAASVIAMAGDELLMSPVSLMMIHNPLTMAFGEESDLKSAIDMLSEVKNSIINAYEKKTGLGRVKIAKMMDSETWLSAQKAVELGFADGILYEESNNIPMESFAFDRMTVMNSIIKRLPKAKKPVIDNGTSYEQLKKRLYLIK